jgi:hypothetical protein
VPRGRLIGADGTAFATSLDEMARNAKNKSMIPEKSEHGWELKIVEKKSAGQQA